MDAALITELDGYLIKSEMYIQIVLYVEKIEKTDPRVDRRETT